MLSWIKTYLLGILATLLLVSTLTNVGLWLSNNSKQDEINKLNVNLGVVAALSQQQKVKIVEAKQIEEKIHVVTNDKVKIVKEYQYDANQTNCSNAINLMRTVF